jgi:hyperosmotically inducible protein
MKTLNKTEGLHVPRMLQTALVASVLLALGACSKTDDSTAGQKLDAAVAKTEQAAADAKAKTESAAASAEAGMKQGAGDAKAAMKDAASTVAAKVDDAAITASVSAGLAKDPDLSAVKIDVETRGGVVTLTGPAPSAAAKVRAEAMAKAVQGVSAVDNKLQVKM